MANIVSELMKRAKTAAGLGPKDVELPNERGRKDPRLPLTLEDVGRKLKQSLGTAKDLRDKLGKK